MKKSSLILKRVFRSAFAIILLASNSFVCNAQEETSVNFKNFQDNTCNKHYINSEKIILNADSEASLKSQIIFATKNKEKNIEIELTKDIPINNTLILDSNINLNLNKHVLKISNPNAQIEIGKKSLIGKFPYQVYHEGYFETVLDSVEFKDKIGSKGKYKQVWIPGYYTTEYKDQFEWDNNISVNIYNGVIEGSDALKVNNKTKAYYLSEAHGENGKSTADIFKLIRGNLSLKDLLVKCGDGSDGGNATYSSLWHIPFGGGDGGNGGKGGNGGNVFFSEKGNVIVNSNCTFITGNPGSGGKGSKANPNYWIYSGIPGENGKNGEKGKIINDKSKLLYL